MDRQPILSLCIPTNGAVEWILPVIESIYAQGYNCELFEVVITDNGKDSQLPSYIAKMNYPNLRYRQTTDDGFLNLVACLKDGKGLFCKMINHRCVLTQGAIENLVSIINRYKDTKPIIYCVNGFLCESPELIECADLDVFVKTMSYWSSWSGGIGLWQEDIIHIDDLSLNYMFPNASLLFSLRDSSKYVVWNKKYQIMGDDAGKGGYNIFETFGVTFIDILNDLRRQGKLTIDTFLYVKKRMYDYVCQLYFQEVQMPTKHTFIVDDAKKYMGVYYSDYEYITMIIKCAIKAPLVKIKRKYLNKRKNVNI